MIITPCTGKFMPFDEIEAVVAGILEPYSGKYLTKTTPFDVIEPTLKNLGDIFYHLLKNALSKHDLALKMLEISENPIHTYIVNKEGSDGHILVGGKKIKISDIVMENITARTTSILLREHEKEENRPESLVQAPAAGETRVKTVGETATATIGEKTKGETAVGTVGETSAESRDKPTAGNEAENASETEAYEKMLSSTAEKAEKRDTRRALPPQKAPAYRFLPAFLFLAAGGALLVYYLKSTGTYPTGSDVYGHLFKADLLYNSIRSGDFYPLYTELWYNGMQPFRYWAPLPYYFLALLQFFASGDVFSAYLLFVFCSFVIGGCGWLLWGQTYNRMALSAFFGAMWFFLPDNIRVFFSEGNVPRMFIAIFLPYLFYFLWRFVEHEKKWSVIPVILIMCCITLSHAMIAAMTGIASFLFLLIYCIIHRHWKRPAMVIMAMLMSFALCGVWLYPALKGGLVAMNAEASGEIIKALSTPVSISLNPFARNHGFIEYYYFGLSVMAICILGIAAAGKKSLPGFITPVAIFLGTTTVAVPVLEKLPFSQLFWMMRFTPIVYAMFVVSVYEWRNCRRYVLVLLSMFLVLDSMPSARFEKYFSQVPVKLHDTLNTARELANQRLSMIDLSTFGSYPSFDLSGRKPETRYTFGWAWQGATTASNIVMLNTAAEKGFYHYLFDRSVELGDDTVIFKKDLLKNAKKTTAQLVKAALASDYRLYRETNDAYIFHRETPGRFGVVTEYDGLTIGESARAITLMYPSFEEGKSDNISDYSIEELCRYHVIYLSGFTYIDKKAAEELLSLAADKGVKIIVDMSRIPVDPVTSRMSFFGVTAQAITFINRYPELMYRDRIYEALPFKEKYSTWNTVYLDNVGTVSGYSWFNGRELPFLGTAESPNILFMGYNLLFHAMETGDEAITELIDDFLEVEPDRLPRREIVPISVEVGRDRLVIDTLGGEINTTIAFQDNFRSNRRILNRNNLLAVVEPHTVIEITYPYLIPGLVLTGAGLLGECILLYLLNREKRYRL